MNNNIFRWLTEVNPERVFDGDADEVINKVGLVRFLAHHSRKLSDFLFYVKETHLEDYLPYVMSVPDGFRLMDEDFPWHERIYLDSYLEDIRLKIAMELGFVDYVRFTDDEDDDWGEFVINYDDDERLKLVLSNGELFDLFEDDDKIFAELHKKTDDYAEEIIRSATERLNRQKGCS